jgi:hypothetical protein
MNPSAPKSKLKLLSACQTLVDYSIFCNNVLSDEGFVKPSTNPKLQTIDEPITQVTHRGWTRRGWLAMPGDANKPASIV